MKAEPKDASGRFNLSDFYSAGHLQGGRRSRKNLLAGVLAALQKAVADKFGPIRRKGKKYPAIAEMAQAQADLARGSLRDREVRIVLDQDGASRVVRSIGTGARIRVRVWS